MTRHVYHSSVTGGEREVCVYAPPGYTAKQKYPVLYLLGGSGELATIGRWRAGPTSYSTTSSRKAELLEQDLRQHMIPLVDSVYSAVRKPSGRALAGLSMGGGGAHDWGTWRHLLAEKLLPGLWRK